MPAEVRFRPSVPLPLAAVVFTVTVYVELLTAVTDGEPETATAPPGTGVKFDA